MPKRQCLTPAAGAAGATTTPATIATAVAATSPRAVPAIGVMKPPSGDKLRLSGEPLLERLLALLATAAARLLRPLEEVGQLGVAVPLRVLRVLLHPQRVAQALLGEPDEVVVLVLRPGYLAGLLRARLHLCLLVGLQSDVPGATPRMPPYAAFCEYISEPGVVSVSPVSSS